MHLLAYSGVLPQCLCTLIARRKANEDRSSRGAFPIRLLLTVHARPPSPGLRGLTSATAKNQCFDTHLVINTHLSLALRRFHDRLMDNIAEL